MKKEMLFALRLVALIALLAACTKSRKAELPEEQQNSVFAVSEFGATNENSTYGISLTAVTKQNGDELNLQAINTESKVLISAGDVNVPSRMKFMFDQLPLFSLYTHDIKITFAVDREFVTAFKIIRDVNSLTLVEKALAVTAKEIQLADQSGKSLPARTAALTEERNKALSERESIKNGSKPGVLLVPLFKYRVLAYGTVVRTKNELKEETSRLELKNSDWKNATHIQLSPHSDSRLVVGVGVAQKKQLKRIFSENKIDNKIMTAEDLQNKLSVGMRFIAPTTKIFTRLDAANLRVYEITDSAQLNENQLRLLKNKTGNQQILPCIDESVVAHIKSTDAKCVIVLKANIPVAYKKAKLAEMNEYGNLSENIEFEDIDRSKSVGLVEIQENTAASQADISNILDPNSSIKLSDLKGEFYYRRTFESSSNMFLGRTGTSGDMAIVRFEIEDSRLVVRNQKSLIEYTGQGPKDREELMSFPAKYFRMQTTDARGSKLTIPVPEETSKEKAEYALIDWRNNTVPDASSPLAFFSGGKCLMANSSLVVTDTDMRLATDGVLNYSLSGSYTVNPGPTCVPATETNSAYWKGSYQFNFNITERISFKKHTNQAADQQIAANLSSMAQAAFNYGVFTLADKVTTNGALNNRDGSEKYMPMIHDFRDGKKLVYHLGGINNPEATPPERRALLVEAVKQVVDEWNRTLKYAFDGTPLERKENYVELIIEETDTGHLGDLDRNYIWLQELPAENNLLGVAQPAANPRSGTIQASNVIVYTGNTYQQTEALLHISKISREYEQSLEKIKKQALLEINKNNKAPVSSTLADGLLTQQLHQQTERVSSQLTQVISALQIDNKNIQNALNNLRHPKKATALKKVLSKDLFKEFSKGQVVNYEVNEETFLKKLADIAAEKKIDTNPYEFELELNKLFIQFGGLSEPVKAALKKRSEMLDAAVRFDRNTKYRPGCFSFARADINDAAAVLDADPKKNLLLNFKKNVMSTLSHEMGHAFGLLHNFKASTDKANYTFRNEKSNRNYSSIMDYIADIDMNYAGPGPYDAHAVRAAYTGLVELSEAGLNDDKILQKANITRQNLTSISEIMKSLGLNSPVHLTKSSLNETGLLKYYEQCDDTDVESSAMCALFDSGGSAGEIVKNLIEDYHRGYLNRNHVFDKIVFSGEQKAQIISRNIALFQNIRSFLDEAVMNIMGGTGLTDEQSEKLLEDQLKAVKIGYKFFHELLRTPNAADKPILRAIVDFDTVAPIDEKQNAQAQIDRENDLNKDGLVANEGRIMAVPYKYTDAEGEEVSDVKILEARSLYDVDLSREKFKSIGIGFDKVFAMMFLLQSTAAKTTDDSRESNISYLDFEQWFMGISDPEESPIMNTILQVLSKNLKVGFFKPGDEISDAEIISVEIPVEVNRALAQQTVVGTAVGLAQGKWKNFDPFAEMFKVGKANQNKAPRDRFNVTKAGQDRALDDTLVLFAAQNAAAANVLVQIAARNELFIDLQGELFKSMQEIHSADSVYRKPIAKIKAEACAKGKETEDCKQALAKKLESYLAENAQLAEAKSIADSIAKSLVEKMRKLNENHLLMTPEMDAEESPVNFFRQVEILRSVLTSQIDMIFSVKAMLEAAPVSQIKQTRIAINQLLMPIREKNKKLESFNLLATGLSFVHQVAGEIKITLQDQEVLPATSITRAIIDADKTKDDLAQQLGVIEKLSKYTAIVDPDSVVR